MSYPEAFLYDMSHLQAAGLWATRSLGQKKGSGGHQHIQTVVVLGVQRRRV
jgi:hypothetical protein